MVLTGHVRNGKIELDQPVAIPEGTVVCVTVGSGAKTGIPSTPGIRQMTKNDLPVMQVGDRVSPIDPVLIRRSLEEEGF